jgi:hypothetical protein
MRHRITDHKWAGKRGGRSLGQKKVASPGAYVPSSFSSTNSTNALKTWIISAAAGAGAGFFSRSSFSFAIDAGTIRFSS